MFYTTLENQKRPDGYGLLYDHFENYNDALAKFYSICAAAVDSGLPYHSAHILDSNGVILKQEIFVRTPESEGGANNV